MDAFSIILQLLLDSAFFPNYIKCHVVSRKKLLLNKLSFRKSSSRKPQSHLIRADVRASSFGFPKRPKLYANHFLTHKRHLYEIILNSLRFLHIVCRSVSACTFIYCLFKKGNIGCVCLLCTFLYGINRKKIPHKHRR